MQKQLLSLLAASLLIAFSFTSCKDANQFADKNTESATPASAQSASISRHEKTVHEDRKIIKTAEIQLKVKKIETQVNDIQQCMQQLGGHISHYEIKNETLQEKTLQTQLDSTCQQQEILPTAFLKLNIPKAQGDSFIRYMLTREARIENFIMDEQDITENLQAIEENIAINKAQELPFVEDRIDAQEQQIQGKAHANQLRYRTQSLWFDIRLSGESYTINQTKPLPPSSYGPFSVRLLTAIKSGWETLAVFIIFLINMWPLLFFSGLLLVIWKKKFFMTHSMWPRNITNQQTP